MGCLSNSMLMHFIEIFCDITIPIDVCFFYIISLVFLNKKLRIQ